MTEGAPQYTDWTYINDTIRWRKVTYIDPMFYDIVSDFQFEVLQKPYFFGLIGKKKWIEEIQSSSWQLAHDWVNHIVKKRRPKIL